MITPEELARHMAAYDQYADVQIAQTRFRMELVKQWQIAAGSRVLEIGCGQGDMTAVLADAVGPDGYVTAVDIADPAYGAPITLGQSARHLLATPLGRRIDFRFNYDLLTYSFPADTFDYVVLAHCSWYVESLDQLRRLLQRSSPGQNSSVTRNGTWSRTCLSRLRICWPC
jgi:SAM-dependent methyltransferase